MRIDSDSAYPVHLKSVTEACASGSITWSLKSLASKPSILPWLKKGMPTRCRGSYGIQIKSLLSADEKSQTRLCGRCGQLRKTHFVVALVPSDSSPVSHSFFGRSAGYHYPGHVRLQAVSSLLKALIGPIHGIQLPDRRKVSRLSGMVQHCGGDKPFHTVN